MCVAGGRVDATLRGFHKQKRKKKNKNKARRKFFSGGIFRFSALCVVVVVGRSHPTHGGVDDAPLFKQERERRREMGGENGK